MTRKPPRHRHKPLKQTPAQAALQAWLELQMHDPVAARLAYTVIGLHAGLIAWASDAEQSFLQPAPQRRHPGEDRELGRGAHISGTRDPDTWMVGVVDWWMLLGHDPEHLDSVRHRMTDRLGRMAGWYLAQPGVPSPSAVPQRWEPLAVRLGDLIGDQVAANALATSILGHQALAITSLDRSVGACKNGREHWRRVGEWYVRVALDEQREHHHVLPRVESVGPDGQRRIG